MKNLAVLVLALCGTRGSLAADPLPGDPNPALKYSMAFLLAPDLPQADRDYLFTNDWHGRKLPERVGELARKYDNEFQLLRAAAKAASPCDWGIDWSPGPMTLLPHLARCKAVSRAAEVRSLWKLQTGDETGAREDLLAALAIARNASRDGTLISALVQIAMENLYCTAVAESFPRFSPESLKILADALEQPPARGTVAACMATEKASFIDWFRRQVLNLRQEHSGDEAKILDGLHEIISVIGSGDGQSADWWPSLAAASGGTSEGVLRLIQEEEEVYTKLTTLLAAPRAEFEREGGPYFKSLLKSPNPLIANTVPSIEKCRTKEFAVLGQMAMLRAAVEYKLHGVAGLQTVPDPFGAGPFRMQRFTFEGHDRGFELKSAWSGLTNRLIFAETDGPPFQVGGPNAGKPAAQ